MRLSAPLVFVFAAVGSVFAVWSLPSVPLLLFSLPCLIVLTTAALDSRYFPAFFLLILALSLFWIQQTKMLSWYDNRAPSVLCRDCYVEGRITETPRIFRTGARQGAALQLKAEKLILFRSSRIEIPFPSMLNVLIFSGSRIPAAGERVRLKGEIRRPRLPRSVFARDESFLMKAEGVSWEIKTFGTHSLKVLSSPSAPQAIINRLRQTVLTDIRLIWGEGKTGSLLTALIAGDRSRLNSGDWDLFRKTGTAHLLAVSGLHMTLLAGFLFSLMIIAGYRFPQAALLAGIFALLYTGIAGGAIPVMRAGFMACFSLGALAWRRKADLMHGLFIAGLMFLVWRPGILFDISFQLSFLAVFALLYLSRRPRVWTDPSASLMQDGWLHVSAAFQTFLFLLPLLAFYFGSFSPAAAFANFAAIPFLFLSLCAAFLSLLLHSCMLPCTIAALISEFCIKMMLGWLKLTTALPFGFVELRTPGVQSCALYYAALAGWICLSERNTVSARNRNLGFAALMLSYLLVLAYVPKPLSAPLAVRLDRGIMIVFQTKGSVLRALYDGARGVDSETAYVLKRVMRQYGSHQIDAFFQIQGTASYPLKSLERLADCGVLRFYFPLGVRLPSQNPFPFDAAALQTGDSLYDAGGFAFEAWGRSGNRLAVRVKSGKVRILTLPPLTDEILSSYRHFCISDCTADFILASPAERWNPELWMSLLALTGAAGVLGEAVPPEQSGLGTHFRMWPESGNLLLEPVAKKS